LDHYLAAAFDDLTRSQIQKLIESQRVQIDGIVVARGSRRLKLHETIRLEIPPPTPLSAAPEEIPLSVVFEDEHVLVLDKPPGMVVHPAQGHHSGTLVNAIVYHCQQQGAALPAQDGGVRPGLVHRIDMDTSGLLVVAKSELALRELSAAIKRHDVERRYLAVVRGTRIAKSGSYDTLFGRHPRDRKRFSSQVRNGKPALTHWTVIAQSETCTLVEVTLETGRTHQIRVHFADHGHALIGDALYGRNLARSLATRYPDEYAACSRFERQALHAFGLTFAHPARRVRLTCSCPPPDDLAALIATLFGPAVAERYAGLGVREEPIAPPARRAKESTRD
ncbi:MAG: RluA family pseudouridine synthase, partial [Myxococcales bacterium]|nr:RluA family pseudouridine synthase [Myxococcales bacterium]